MRHPTMLLCLLTVACGSPPVAPERLASEERRLLQPFIAGAEVGCGELQIEATGNFAHYNIASPSVDVRLHHARKEQGNGYLDTIFTNLAGTPEGAFVVTIGENDEGQSLAPVRYTRFTVLREVRIRVLQGTHPLTLRAAATGQPLMIKEAGVVRDLDRFEAADGVLHAR